jgi:type VI secretion system protein VasJ
MSDVATWLEPIAGEAPGGRDARHEPEHERIRAELEKLSSVHGKSVDWELIRRDGQVLLQHKSKDLLIGAYLAFAWAKLEGLAGLARGMSLLASLLERYPDVLQPQRARARANALSWFAERAAQLPGTEGCHAADAAVLRSAYGALLASARTALGDECPALNELGRAVERATLSVRAVEAVSSTGQGQQNGGPAAPASGAAAATPSADPRQAADAESRSGADPHASTAWLAPIAGPARAGADASQDDAYFAVQGEIEKLQSLEGTRPDWDRVFALCSELLAKRTKDFTLLGYLALALLETQGLAGLTRGLSALSGLLDAYWEDGFPPVQRSKRRANGMSFVLERLALALPRAVTSKTPEAGRAALDALDALAARVLQRFPGPDAPSLAPLREALTKLPDSAADPQLPGDQGTVPTPDIAAAPAPVPASTASSTPPAPSGLAPLTAPAPIPAPADTSALGPFLSATAASLADAACGLLEAEPTAPGAYRLLRIGLWLELEGLPPAQGDGRTRIRAPEKRVRDALASLVAAARWDLLLIQSEATLRANPLWLDACWLSARALEALGETHLAAKAAVECESRALTRRLPQLLALRFLDGTPIVSPEAAAWFRAGTSGDEITPNEQAESGPPKAFQSALEAALGAGDAAAARELELLLRSAASAREAFQWRLVLARSVENSGKLEAAAALYLGLERDVDAHRLEDWEPELAREVFSALWALLRRKASLLTAADAQRICARLARLSPLALT